MVFKQSPGERLRELALFAGGGGGILGGRILGWRTVCAVEIEQYARDILLARQNDGTLEPFPVWDDVRTFDGKPWRGFIDVVSGGFPCQDISCAGKGEGIDGERSGLWREMARIIREVRPRSVFVENTPPLRTRGLTVVLRDLAEMGFDAQWGNVSAENCGAPHRRDRIWIVAHSNEECGHTRPERVGRQEGTIIGGCSAGADVAHPEKQYRAQYGQSPSQLGRGGENVADPGEQRLERSEKIRRGSKEKGSEPPRGEVVGEGCEVSNACRPIEGWRNVPQRKQEERMPQSSWYGQNWEMVYTDCYRCYQARKCFAASGCNGIIRTNGWPTEPDVGRVVARCSFRVDRLKALGNIQLPIVAATAWRILNNV